MSCKIIKKEILDGIRKLLPELPRDFSLELEIPPRPEMGDLSLACFNLAKLLKKSPVETAADLVSICKGSTLTSFISRMENVGPYLNFFLKKEAWFKEVCEEILKKREKFGKSSFGKGRRILIEYSAPNTNKPQHLGHLRNNFLGWAVANLLTAVGFKVVKANLVNDRGIHICKSMLAYQKWGKNRTPESEKIKGDHFVGQYYVLFEQKSKKNPELLKEAQKMLARWEAGDSEILSLWQQMNKWALDGFVKTYKKIGISFDKWYFESDTYNSGKKIILRALKKKLCERREDGTIEIDLIKDGLGKKVLLRADGTSVYVTQDIGLAKLKQRDFRPDKSIYVVASEQDYHFKVLFKVLELFGFDWVKNCQHLSYGMVFLPQGKMKSREGRVVDADEIINQMEQLAKSEILARDPDLSPSEVLERAQIIALAALKFYFLKFTPAQIVHFNPEESISFEGATGPYIQYAYARIQSIIEKSKSKNQSTKQNVLCSAEPINMGSGQKSKINYSVLRNKEEVELLKQMFQFPDMLEKSALDFNPAHLANYLLKLAQKFNEFYHEHPVLRAKTNDLKKARLVLIQTVALVIKKGLNLLGIEVLDKM